MKETEEEEDEEEEEMGVVRNVASEQVIRMLEVCSLNERFSITNEEGVPLITNEMGGAVHRVK